MKRYVQREDEGVERKKSKHGGGVDMEVEVNGSQQQSENKVSADEVYSLERLWERPT